MKQQRGGTILGFIIGVVVGLGAALAVAVYVTKVPVPFVNKGQSHTPEQDAAEAKKNKDWDPNAPLYGKNPARSAAMAPAPAASAPAAPAAAKTETKPAVTADPLGDLAKAKTAAADPFAYFVQAGAFRTPEDAESQRAKLSLAGVEAKVSEREQSGRMVYRVRVGPFDKRDEAERTKDKLDGAGYETALVRVQR
ncbi:MAG: sporulation protein [Curvibacter sp. GWA2_64_110]|nr:MAG: sporulation protein [Curvibacter sp. GWA2_64_110]HCY15204.1 sporulation protein [Curvibacter sp.]